MVGTGRGCGEASLRLFSYLCWLNSLDRLFELPARRLSSDRDQRLSESIKCPRLRAMLHTQDTDPNRTYCFSVRADAEPSVLPRLLELFTKRGLIPAALHSRCHDQANGALQVDIEAAGLEWDLADYLQRCMRQIVGVELVLVSKKYHVPARTSGSITRASS